MLLGCYDHRNFFTQTLVDARGSLVQLSYERSPCARLTILLPSPLSTAQRGSIINRRFADRPAHLLIPKTAVQTMIALKSRTLPYGKTDLPEYNVNAIIVCYIGADMAVCAELQTPLDRIQDYIFPRPTPSKYCRKFHRTLSASDKQATHFMLLTQCSVQNDSARTELFSPYHTTFLIQRRRQTE